MGSAASRRSNSESFAWTPEKGGYKNLISRDLPPLLRLTLTLSLIPSLLDERKYCTTWTRSWWSRALT